VCGRKSIKINADLIILIHKSLIEWKIVIKYVFH
jgi:hypothetical protein